MVDSAQNSGRYSLVVCVCLARIQILSETFWEFDTPYCLIFCNPIRKLVVTPKWLHLLYCIDTSFPKFDNKIFLEKLEFNFYTQTPSEGVLKMLNF